MKPTERGLTLIAGVVTICICVVIAVAIAYLCVRCVKRVKSIGKKYEQRLTNELAQAVLVLPMVETNGEWVAEIPEAEVEPMLDRLTDVTVESSYDCVVWQDRMTVRTDPWRWEELAWLLAEVDWSYGVAGQFYRARW